MTSSTPPATPSPAPTASPAPSHTVTPLPAPILTPTATQAGQSLFKTPGLYPIQSSPDGQWYFQLEDDPEGLWTTHLVKADGSQEWRVSFDRREFPHKQDESLYLAPFFWLPKEPYVFLKGTYAGKCGWEVFTLRRLNLKTGQVATLFPGIPCGPGSLFSFSNTGRFLLHSRPDWTEIRLQRLSDGETSSVKIPFHFAEITVMAWSPDETRAVLLACQVDAGRREPCQSKPVFWLDAENVVYHRLIPDLSALQGGGCWSSVTWLSPNRVNIHFDSGAAWEANLVNGQLLQRSPVTQPCQPAANP